MNKTCLTKFFLMAQILLAPAGIFLAPAVVAQENESQIQERYLFIFSTSAEMKKRVPSTEAEINQLLSLSMNGALHSGDSIGVWTLDKNLHVGQFPLFTWRPENAAEVAKAMNKFIGRQHYTGTNNFNALLPVLERVIQSSPRLTVLIFCDGGSEINGTPYDDGINPIFKQRFAEQKRNREPFIVVLRAQFGRYVGSSVNFPPGMVNLPAFPPIPKPEPPAPPPVTNAPPAPIAPLVVVGTRVETNWEAYQRARTNVPNKLTPPEETISNSPAKSNSPPAGVEEKEKQENPPEHLETNAVAKVEEPGTNAASVQDQTNTSANANSMTNAVPVADNQNFSANGTVALAAGFLIGAVTLGIIYIVRSRRDHGSLISRSMRK